MRCVLALGVLLISGCGDVAQAPPVAEAPAVETGTARFGQSEIYFEVAGAGKPAVILIHGGLLDCTMWDEQFALLAASHRVVRYDASAHGRSPLPPEAYLDHLDLLGLMDALEINKAVLVGLSLGGRIAIDLALEHPERVVAVVAVSPGLSGYRFTSESYLKNRNVMIAAWKAGDFDQVVESFQRSWTDGPQRTPDQVDPVVRERVRAMARNGIEHAMEGRLLQPPAVERLDQLEAQMLVIVGELDDPGIHEIGSMLVNADPNAELVTVPGVAHMVNLEAPERFNELLLGFLDRL